ncbi:MAG: hypothetical protein MJ237_04690 [bacterium]|nr:hypothetical protein [bacterium]
MVQGVSGQSNNNFGTINRIGTTTDGRIIYELKDPEGNTSGRVSLPQTDCDRFEKAYNDILSVAPQMSEYMKNKPTPEEMKKRKKLSKLLVLGPAAIGALIPAIVIKKGKHVELKQVLFTIGGFIAGLVGGINLNKAIMLPPGATKFTKATQELSKLDIKAA